MSDLPASRYGDVQASTSRREVAGRGVRSVLIVSALLLLAGAGIAFRLHRSLEFPLINYVDSFARVYPVLDHATGFLTAVNLTAGVAFLAVIWWLWFARAEEERLCLLLGVVGSAVAALVSRTLQIVLPTHLRPLHEPALHLTLPLHVDPDALNHFNSFPSDHASLLFGFATTIWLVSRRLGLAAFVWAALVTLARVYEMYHFPSDIVAGASLGALAVCLAQAPAMMKLGRWALVWEKRAPPWFYAAAFIGSYLSATLFEDIRTLGKGAAKLLVATFLNT